ncbi:hypothetical protein SKAU_G00074530 [Synaphobranchus kaupii]|uniref:Uncharacterized protein n=1 Tax=Synaphobranchus kaupii TaxID=118154 RepID=A0A9Q1G8D4_SYNKA|nr:hypothetical protein SKAU_G00074530 [Synaphobranchus kaupii]
MIVREPCGGRAVLLGSLHSHKVTVTVWSRIQASVLTASQTDGRYIGLTGSENPHLGPFNGPLSGASSRNASRGGKAGKGVTIPQRRFMETPARSAHSRCEGSTRQLHSCVTLN